MDPKQVLKNYWRYDSFRPMQEEIILSVLEGRDTLALMPTGGGKSLCFQVPALCMDGLCLVISPLIALMKDQVQNLRKKNITAYAVYSGMSYKEVKNILSTAGDSNCKFLYVSPERLGTSLFREYLPALGVSLVAIDEAHCISQWGYDFRPPYLRIAELREELPGIPFLALTASATEDVQIDICEKLQFDHGKIFRKSFARPNLAYHVNRVDSKINRIVELLNQHAGSAIIYCKSRKRTKEFSDLLQLHGFSAACYHAGLTAEERSERQESWIKSETCIMVCTNAFGMGIDKPDVRLVIHADIPDCLENYYQESGRAGRDEKKATAVLLYMPGDLTELKNVPEIRFPSPENIRLVYQSVMNYLQVPAGGGEGIYYDFDLTDFTKKFKLDSFLAWYALKALEQEDLLTLNDYVFLPSKLQVTANRVNLENFQEENPELEPLVKVLLRTYGGILDQPVIIQERTIAMLLRLDLTEVTGQLKRLHQTGIVEYQQQKESPQLFISQPRIRADDLLLDLREYYARKEKCRLRVEKLLGFVYDQAVCRSKMIAGYFGDDAVEDCGHCDNCLKNRQREFTETEFDEIMNRILSLTADRPFRVKELLTHFKQTDETGIKKVINFLQQENKLESDEYGFLSPVKR